MKRSIISDGNENFENRKVVRCPNTMLFMDWYKIEDDWG